MSPLATESPRAEDFARQARARGVPRRLVRVLQPAAEETCPLRPARILESRELFERAALHAAAGRGGNLELSFRTVDALASCVETLGLARASDVPDPFRRLWVQTKQEARRPGVVLACGDGEVAVLCPPSRGPIPDAGTVLTLSYRGFSSTVQYDLRLDDPVRLPRGLILNLTRVEGGGAIGRVHERFSVYLPAKVGRQPEGAAPAESVPCEVLDLSATGLRMECGPSFATGDVLWIELLLPEQDEPLFARVVVRWARASGGQRSHGLLFDELSPASRARLERYLETLRPA